MKPLVTAILLSLAAAPSLALGVDMGTMFPPLTFPETVPAPAPETVTQDGNDVLK
ncbi:hypothetical protein [Roseovarius sp. 2305UL8-3]|uniref:hypothetical protein n=1 Tax=Roseovarius conchicola TaxID=3121636 RepID=UPI00352955F7